MNLGKTPLAQLMDFLPWKTFHRIVNRHDGDRYVKSLTCADRSTEFNYQNLAPGAYFDYTFSPNASTQYLFPNIYLPYNCEDSNYSAFLIIRPTPVAIYPKQYLLSTQVAFDIGVYVLANTDGEYDSDIKQLSITVDGASFFKGNILDYKNFVATQTALKPDSYVLSAYCSRGDPFSIICIGTKGYAVTNFHIPANTFKQGTHIVRVKLTLNTPLGDADYEDKAEYLIMEPY